VRVIAVIGFIAALFYLPTREFFKITFIFAIPFLFLARILVKKRKYSSSWIIAAVIIMLTIGAYGYMLTQLPDRIEIRKIVSEGAALLAEGKYDQAIQEYQKLEYLGQQEKMNHKIAEAKIEKQAAIQVEQALQLLKEGAESEAISILKSVPSNTRAEREATRILKLLQTEQ